MRLRNYTAHTARIPQTPHTPNAYAERTPKTRTPKKNFARKQSVHFPHDNARHFLEKIFFLFPPLPLLRKSKKFSEKFFLRLQRKNPQERKRGNTTAHLSRRFIAKISAAHNPKLTQKKGKPARGSPWKGIMKKTISKIYLRLRYAAKPRAIAPRIAATVAGSGTAAVIVATSI